MSINGGFDYPTIEAMHHRAALYAVRQVEQGKVLNPISFSDLVTHGGQSCADDIKKAYNALWIEASIASVGLAKEKETNERLRLYLDPHVLMAIDAEEEAS